MVLKLIAVAALFAGFFSLGQPTAPSKALIAEEGDLNPQPLPPWAGDDLVQVIG